MQDHLSRSLISLSVVQATINSSLHVDPTSHESLIASSRVTLACMPALGKITNVWQTGEIGAEQTVEVSPGFYLVSASSPQQCIILICVLVSF
jgi:exosome complex RNA-binding protein Rrp42 (RNase PH superfamily)